MGCPVERGKTAPVIFQAQVTGGHGGRPRLTPVWRVTRNSNSTATESPIHTPTEKRGIPSGAFRMLNNGPAVVQAIGVEGVRLLSCGLHLAWQVCPSKGL